MASFYLRGINWKDMALLRVENIQGDFERINYLRIKTKNKRFSIKINPKLKECITSYLGDDYDQQDFLFPILRNQIRKPDTMILLRTSARSSING
jgi:hypothetical protein